MKTLIKNAWILTMDEVLTTYPTRNVNHRR